MAPDTKGFKGSKGSKGSKSSGGAGMARRTPCSRRDNAQTHERPGVAVVLGKRAHPPSRRVPYRCVSIASSTSSVMRSV